MIRYSVCCSGSDETNFYVSVILLLRSFVNNEHLFDLAALVRQLLSVQMYSTYLGFRDHAVRR